ncbi:MAG: hypothetical protein IJY62_02520 [Clostridia bacterium]|nr:hypothetical protein [Clostridia bacterium]
MDVYERVKSFYLGVKGEKTVIGKSVFGRELFAVRLGEGRPVGLAQYAMHGREFITALLALGQYARGLKQGSVWLVPLVNPDGALLSQVGLDAAPKRAKETREEWNGGRDFSLWKANGRGVDLNVNWNADWGKGKRNVSYPASENCIGEKPFSEPETRALKAFTEKLRPDYTVSYHTKGEEIYWYFGQSLADCVRDKAIALKLSDSTGYPLKFAHGSAGGYKDWCIKRLKIPAFTIEVGRDDAPHPLGEGALSDILQKNVESLNVLSEAIR